MQNRRLSSKELKHCLQIKLTCKNICIVCHSIVHTIQLNRRPQTSGCTRPCRQQLAKVVEVWQSNFHCHSTNASFMWLLWKLPWCHPETWITREDAIRRAWQVDGAPSMWPRDERWGLDPEQQGHSGNSGHTASTVWSVSAEEVNQTKTIL